VREEPNERQVLVREELNRNNNKAAEKEGQIVRGNASPQTIVLIEKFQK